MNFLDFDSYLPNWRKESFEKSSISTDIAPHILSFYKFSISDLGTYLCTTKNKKGFLVEIGIKIDIDQINKKLFIKNIKETLLPNELQPVDEFLTNVDSSVPNIRISFSDKLAISNAERVEILCETGKY